MYFTTDTIQNAITTDGDSEFTEDLSLDAVSKTVIDDAPFTRAFDTDTFYKFDVVIARPIEQQYVHDGDVKTFKKPSEELQKAAWSADNAPYPLTHPDTKAIVNPSQIHGFHRRPRYVTDHDSKGDGLVTTLFVPVTDDVATDFLKSNRGVSVGVYNDLDWETDEESVDAYQTNMYFDHIAGVENGRCSLEDGCGIVTDSEITVLDSVEAPPSEMETFGVGETVKWTTEDGSRHGKVLDNDESTYEIALFDYETKTFDESSVVTHDSSALHPWVGPTADSCRGDSCSCGCHTNSTTNMSDTNSEEDSSTDLDLDSMVEGLTVDAIAERNDEVAQLYEDAQSYEDKIDVLEDKVESLEQTLDETEQKLTEFEEGKREPKSVIVDSITELTSAWDEDELMNLDHEKLKERKQIAEDAATSTSTPSDDEGGNDEPTTDSEQSEDGSPSKPDFDSVRSWRN